jgi:hypothetical protein
MPPQISGSGHHPAQSLSAQGGQPSASAPLTIKKALQRSDGTYVSPRYAIPDQFYDKRLPIDALHDLEAQKIADHFRILMTGAPPKGCGQPMNPGIFLIHQSILAVVCASRSYTSAYYQLVDGALFYLSSPQDDEGSVFRAEQILRDTFEHCFNFTEELNDMLVAFLKSHTKDGVISKKISKKFATLMRHASDYLFTTLTVAFLYLRLNAHPTARALLEKLD